MIILIKSWRRHKHYQRWLITNCLRNYLKLQTAFEFYDQLLSKLYYLDLDPAMKLLESRYPQTGRPAVNQAEILRALVAMLACGEDSITVWVRRLRAEPVLALACGFDPDGVAGVGSFYDFLERLWSTERKARLRKPSRKPGKPRGKNKLPVRRPGIIKRLVDKALQGRSIHRRPEGLLQLLFKEIAVMPSARMGLLGDPGKLTIAGDGTPIESGSNPYGKRSCECVKRCDCKRIYSDPDARWGWDSYNEKYFWGYSLYVINTPDGPHDLPLHLRPAQAQRHDSVLSVFSLVELNELFEEFVFAKAIYDSAHDVYDIYRLHNEWGIEPFIDLNKRNMGNRKHRGPIRFTDGGVPVCPQGHPMVHWGLCRNDRLRIKWRCPLACGKVRSCETPCSDSAYGRTVYTKPKDDYRLFTSTPRRSKRWKRVFRKRSSVERCIKRLTVDYGTEKTRSRSRMAVFARQIFAAVNVHLDAQLQNRRFSFFELLKEMEPQAA